MYDLTDTLAVYANTARSFKPNSGASRQDEVLLRKKANPSNWV